MTSLFVIICSFFLLLFSLSEWKKASFFSAISCSKKNYEQELYAARALLAYAHAYASTHKKRLPKTPSLQEIGVPDWLKKQFGNSFNGLIILEKKDTGLLIRAQLLTEKKVLHELSELLPW